MLEIRQAMTKLIVLVILASLMTRGARAQGIPPNARAVSWGKGWVCNQGYVERAQECIVLGAATDDEVRQYLINESMGSYSGSCPCPYNVDRAGRRCGGRSAYSRPGGRSPLCYPTDVPDAQVRRARERYPAPRRTPPDSPPAPLRPGMWLKVNSSIGIRLS